MEPTFARSDTGKTFDLSMATAGPNSARPKPTQFPEKHSILDRLRCIEIVAWWEGSISTVALMHWFGVSRKKATQDLAYYRAKNPEALEYDRSRKVFIITDAFTPLYGNLQEEEYLQHLDRCSTLASGAVGISMESPGAHIAAFPKPRVSAPLFRAILGAIRSKVSIQFYYLELSDNSKHLNYRHMHVMPLKLVSTPVGWHIRVYDHQSRAFDVLRFNRIYGEPTRSCEQLIAPEDTDWIKQVLLMGEPRTSLSEDEVALTSVDWGISSSNPLVIPVRKCLVGVTMYYWQSIDSRLSFRVVESPSADWLNVSGIRI